MNLRKKKILAAKTLGVGKERISFVKPRLDEIKEAITKQDIRDLHKEGAIIIKKISGRKKIEKRKRKRGVGKIRNIPNTKKREYMILTRKLRKYLKEVKSTGIISKNDLKNLRKAVRNKAFKSKSNLKEYLKEKRK